MNRKTQYIIPILITITFVLGVGFSTRVLLKNNQILEHHYMIDNKCNGDSLRIVSLENKIDSLIKITIKKK